MCLYFTQKSYLLPVNKLSFAYILQVLQETKESACGT